MNAFESHDDRDTASTVTASGEKPVCSVRCATELLFRRYLALLCSLPGYCRESASGRDPQTSLANLTWMCRTGIEQIDTFPLDKLSRWLGFIQGVLAMRGLVTVDGERDFSRPLFHAAYAAEGTLIPATRSMFDDQALGIDPDVDPAAGREDERRT